MVNDPRHGPLPVLLLVLTAVAGAVDAISYLRLGHVFVANMTGNVVFLGFAAAGAPGVSATGAAIALGAFFAGSVAGGRLGAAAGGHRGHLLALAEGIGTALLVVAAAIAIGGSGAVADFGLVAVLAATMGLQSATARAIGVPDLNTTVVTMTLAALAAESHRVGGARLALRLAAIGAMLAGAILGGLVVLRAGVAAALIGLAAIAALTSVTVLLRSKASPTWAKQV